nr:hypothetical protein [Tanacetum cinerariifolium]
MDQKLKGYARSAKNKRRLENNLRENRGQQPVFKRQNVRGHNLARAYTAENKEKKGYVGSLPYCNKCKMHHTGPCTVRCGKCKRVGHMTRDCKFTVTPNTQTALAGNQPVIVCYECGSEATTKGYAIGGGGANPDSNVVTGLLGHSFNIDLMPVELGSFDVIIGDDCDSESKSKLNIISCTKTQKYIQKGCHVYLAQVTSKKTEDKSEEKRLEDVPIVREFPKVFLEDLHGLPPAQKVEFQIDLVPDDAPAMVNDVEPWYADYVSYIVGKVVPPKWTSKRRKRCVAGSEMFEILAHCHSGPTGGHNSVSVTGRKVYESGFFWPNIFKDTKDDVI